MEVSRYLATSTKVNEDTRQTNRGVARRNEGEIREANTYVLYFCADRELSHLPFLPEELAG